MLTITGEILREGAYYSAMLEQLGAYAQGKTRAAARQALVTTILAHASDVGLADGFSVEVTDDGEGTLYVTSPDTPRLIALLLRRQRDLRGMSLAAAAAAVGTKSRNGIAQYEQGRIDLSVSKLSELLGAVGPELILAVIPRTARVVPRWDEEADDAEEIKRLLENPSRATVQALRTKHARTKRRPRAA
jgi:transcriptional regulator with XRE-family HTH domain